MTYYATSQVPTDTSDFTAFDIADTDFDTLSDSSGLWTATIDSVGTLAWSYNGTQPQSVSWEGISPNINIIGFELDGAPYAVFTWQYLSTAKIYILSGETGKAEVANAYQVDDVTAISGVYLDSETGNIIVSTIANDEDGSEVLTAIYSGYDGNSAPSLAKDPETAMDASVAATVSRTLLGADADSAFAAINGFAPDGGAIVLTDMNGDLLVIPTLALAEGETATLTIQYSLTDGAAVTTGGVLTVTVTGTGSRTLELTLDQYATLTSSGVSSVTMLGGVYGNAVVAATGNEILSLSEQQLNQLVNFGVTTLDLTDAVSMSVGQAESLMRYGLYFGAGDDVTIADMSYVLETLTDEHLSNLATLGVSRLDAVDDMLNLSLNQITALDSAGIDLAASDFVIVADTADAVTVLFGGHADAIMRYGVDVVRVLDGGVVTIAADVAAFLTAMTDVHIAEAGAVILRGSAAEIGEFGAGRIDALSALGVTVVDLTDDAITIDLAQALAYGLDGIRFAPDDTVTVSMTASEFYEVPVSDLAALGASGVHSFSISGGDVTLSLDQAVTLLAYGVAVSVEGHLTLADAGPALGSLPEQMLSDLAALGVTVIDATDDAASFSLGQIDAIAGAGMSLTAADAVTLADTAETLSALTIDDVMTLTSLDVDAIQVSDGGAVSLSLGMAMQLSALDGVSVNGAASITVTGLGAEIAEIGATRVAALSALGVTQLDASDDAVTLSLAQADALSESAITLADSDMLTVTMSAADLAELTPRPFPRSTRSAPIAWTSSTAPRPYRSHRCRRSRPAGSALRRAPSSRLPTPASTSPRCPRPTWRTSPSSASASWTPRTTSRVSRSPSSTPSPTPGSA
jgi:hypothetical protein